MADDLSIDWRSKPKDTQLQLLLELWDTIQQNPDQENPDDFVILYRYSQELRKESHGPYIRERLGKQFTKTKCILYLLKFYPMLRPNMAMVKRFREILEELVKKATGIEYMDENSMDIYWEDYYPPGNFSQNRSEILGDILRGPRLKVACYDVYNQDNEDWPNQDKYPNFWLDQLLIDNTAYTRFQEFWGNMQEYDFSDIPETDIVTRPAVT